MNVRRRWGREGGCSALDYFDPEIDRRATLAEAQVVPDAIRCVQCGICSYNCPVDIDVRSHARIGRVVASAHCISCGECVRRCPRGVLHLELNPLFASLLEETP
jgi:ferredoxin